MNLTPELEREIRQTIATQRISDLYTDHCEILLAEIDRLREQVRDMARVRDQYAAAAFENQRDLIKALTALEPFAALAPQIRLSVQNSNVMYAYNDTLITAGDFRRAALAVEAHPAPAESEDAR